MRKRLLACLLALSALSLARAGSLDPSPREGDAQASWMQKHEAFVQRAKQGGIDVLFLGDSITHRWPPAIWDEHLAPLRAAQFGIEGELIQNLHWRLLHGELEGIQPRLVVLLIGTNNVPRPYSSEEIVQGIRDLLSALRGKLPQAKVLLMGIFPRGELPSLLFRDRIRLVNMGLAALDDGRSVRFLDLGPRLTQPNGAISKEIMPDFLHLSDQGYQIWIDAMKPLVNEMLKP